MASRAGERAAATTRRAIHSPKILWFQHGGELTDTQIVYDFPVPPIPLPTIVSPTIDPDVVASTPPQLPIGDAGPRGSELELPDAGEGDTLPNSQSSTKENDAPIDIAANKSSVPKFDSSISSSSQPMEPLDTIDTLNGALPPDLLCSYQSSVRTLENSFAQCPPYTIQRLAELVLYPRRHYRFLPTYLRALDRVVSVTSPASEFPLPVGSVNSAAGFLTNGDAYQINGIQEREGLGSDESLGGALLTPIPWLRNSTALATQAGSHPSDGEFHSERMDTILGPNGAGSVETVTVTVNGVPSASSAAHTSPSTSTPASPTLSEQSDASTNSSGSMSTEAQLRELGGVTQGELLRQEQEAGVVPVAQSAPRRTMMSASMGMGTGTGAMGRATENGGAVVSTEARLEPQDEMPHARGPEIIGMEDTGTVQRSNGLNMDAAVERGHSRSPQPPRTQPSETAGMVNGDAKMGDAGGQGQDPQDVEKEVEKLRDALDEEREQEAKDADGDVLVDDADGRQGHA